MEKIQDQTCPICLENKEDLRMLPCWHVACMNCILSMAQRGEGRAVKCHICRQICLFENIRYLPKPLRCGCCNQFLKCSKIMPCCSKLYCVDCITRKSTENDAQLTCPGRCPRDFNSVDELPQSKLCSSCLHFHSDDTTLGDYSICARCDQKVREDIRCACCNQFLKFSKFMPCCSKSYCLNCLTKKPTGKEGCPLCSAVKSPAPIPTDPIQPVQGQIEITMEGLENSNYRPLQQNRMGFFVPPHTLS
uniref:tripartite motif-containing protein 59-like isoform X3 n=1 Tax=Styela clava TaxID=7725 RepID=UPI001939A234|nr:tripartite motif-containing protein 59-like isoform X3 [Styela clava]